jgi:hypothetical protein
MDVESLAWVIPTSSITGQSSSLTEFTLGDSDKLNHRAVVELGVSARRSSSLSRCPSERIRTGRRNASRREAALGGE